MNDEVFLGDPRDLIDEDRLLGRVAYPEVVRVLSVDRIPSTSFVDVYITFEWVASSVRQTVTLGEDDALDLMHRIGHALDDRTSAFDDEPDPPVLEEHEVGAA